LLAFTANLPDLTKGIIMSGVNEIRSKFLDFFGKNGHEIVSSSPLVPRNDPTLMFTNAGMVQFKNSFTGLENRPYSTATTSQKCVRAGGKHNDLDNVGYTARHHTFFEMLGNFSFGDYFKEQAIELAWKLLTKEYDIDAKRLLVTIYHNDDEAYNLWKKIAGLNDDRIIRISTLDNFWSMGDTGPCGPCSEIFFDHGDKIFGGPPGSDTQDGDRFIEIWNLVFMQFEQLSSNQRVDLPRPSIDTGMGLERIAAVLQGEHDNYDIDLFKVLIRASENATNTKAEGKNRASHRVIADHLRASAFLITDGVLPSNEGRGYVLRRIMRRAMRHAQLLGARDPLMHALVPALVKEMGLAYPELQRTEKLISETLQLEELKFRKTLERGLGLLEEATSDIDDNGTLDGTVAFKLYDTYGFPLDLTQDALRSRNISVNLDDFNQAMELQKATARASWSGSGDAATEKVWFAVKDTCGSAEFLGYECEQAEGMITAIVQNGTQVTTAKTGDEVALIINQTPFYAESGGQIGDNGVICGDGFKVIIKDTIKKADGLIVHLGLVEAGSLEVGANVVLSVDHARRTQLCANHSATHLLHEALRHVLGSHVAQKGSLVTNERIRFDFSHPKALTEQEISHVERIVNDIVVQNGSIITRIMSVDNAIELGAMALFGEKYGDDVRVVFMGKNQNNTDYSIEFCGGTHAKRTGDIGLIRVLSDSGIASGVRRLEAVTGTQARLLLGEQDRRLKTIAATLKTTPQDALSRIDNLIEENRKLERDVTELRKKLIAKDNKIEIINDINFIGRIVDNIDAKDLKPMIEDAKKSIGSGVVMFVSKNEDGKASVAVGVTPDLTSRLQAQDLVRIAATLLGGSGGGGRPEMAQAGGTDGSKAINSIDAVKAALK
jgi:alanyl-tRNA synthetase